MHSAHTWLGACLSNAQYTHVISFPHMVFILSLPTCSSTFNRLSDTSLRLFLVQPFLRRVFFSVQFLLTHSLPMPACSFLYYSPCTRVSCVSRATSLACCHYLRYTPGLIIIIATCGAWMSVTSIARREWGGTLMHALEQGARGPSAMQAVT